MERTTFKRLEYVAEELHQAIRDGISDDETAHHVFDALYAVVKARRAAQKAGE